MQSARAEYSAGSHWPPARVSRNLSERNMNFEVNRAEWRVQAEGQSLVLAANKRRIGYLGSFVGHKMSVILYEWSFGEGKKEGKRTTIVDAEIVIARAREQTKRHPTSKWRNARRRVRRRPRNQFGLRRATARRRQRRRPRPRPPLPPPPPLPRLSSQKS